MLLNRSRDRPSTRSPRFRDTRRDLATRASCRFEIVRGPCQRTSIRSIADGEGRAFRATVTERDFRLGTAEPATNGATLFPRETDRKRNRGGTRKATRRGKFYIIISPNPRVVYSPPLATTRRRAFRCFDETPLDGESWRDRWYRGPGGISRTETSLVLRKARRSKRRKVGTMALRGYKPTTPCYLWAFSFDGGTNDRTAERNGLLRPVGRSVVSP